jgi:hypothetical protein
MERFFISAIIKNNPTKQNGQAKGACPFCFV